MFKAKSVRRWLAVIAVNLLLFFLFAELIGLGVHFYRTGYLFYSHRPTYHLIEEDGETRTLSPKRIHPYFGYVDRPGWQRNNDTALQNVDLEARSINNHGLSSSFDYPFLRSSDDQFIIGIFGGSVAEQFALLGQDRLIESLSSHKYFADKEIVVLNFAKGGYKQPQQLLLLLYFLSIGQEYDLVVNIDGFNEAAFSHRNYQRGVDLSMPHINIMDGLTNLIDQTTLTPAKLESLARIQAYKSDLNRIARAINTNHFAAYGLVLEQYYQSVFHQYQSELNRFSDEDSTGADASLLFIKSDDTAMEDSELFGAVADRWLTASLMMHTVLAGRGTPYLHFLQPNQYFSDRIFSEAEANIALEETPYYATLVRLGYPVLIEQAEALDKQGVTFVSAVSIFDHEPRPVFSDSCCHYNQLGNDLLAEFMAAAIAEAQLFSDRE